MTVEVTVDADSIVHRKMPDNEDKQMAALTLSEAELADHYDISGEFSDESSVLVPLRRELNGTVDFERVDYNDDETVTLVHTDDQHQSLSERLGSML